MENRSFMGKHSNGKEYRKNAVKIARELGYSNDVIEKIQNAKNEQQISTIMYTQAMKIGEE